MSDPLDAINPFTKRYRRPKMGPTVECTQCHRKMDKVTGDIQVENKRENAPICIPCIMGYPRRKLQTNEPTEEEDTTTK